MRSPERFLRDSYRNPSGVQTDPGRDGYGSRDEGREGKGFTDKAKNPGVKSPNPKAVILASESDPLVARVYSILDGGVASIDHLNSGRPWPLPNRAALQRLCATQPEDLCLKAAREAREIVQAQDRAPNITGLYEKKLRDLAAGQAERDGVRETIRESLGDAA